MIRNRCVPVFLALAGAALLSGCGTSIRRIEPPDDFKKAVQELLQLEDEHTASLEEIKKIEAELPVKRQALEPLKKQADQLTEQLRTFEKADEIAYDQFAHLSVTQNGVAVQKAARNFIRDYPASALVPDAKTLLTSADAVVAKSLDEKKQHDEDMEARELARKRALDERFARRDLSIAELKTYLQNKTQDEIVALLGQPSAANSAVWAYEGSFVTDATGQKRGINIFFTGGHVNSVGVR